jgi:hypothetical protein
VEIDGVMKRISRVGLEYDGYRNWYVLFAQTIVGWCYPVFLNAEIFSNFRFFSKKELYNQNRGLSMSFYLMLGTYLATP